MSGWGNREDWEAKIAEANRRKLLGSGSGAVPTSHEKGSGRKGEPARSDQGEVPRLLRMGEGGDNRVHDPSLPGVALSALPDPHQNEGGKRSHVRRATKVAKSFAPAPLSEAGSKRRSKYGAVRTNGYASAKEAKRAAELKLLEQAGKIRNLREQVVYELLPKQQGERGVTYRADFVYEQVDSLGKVHKVCEDVKGFSTSYYILKRKMLLFFHGIQIRQT